VKPPASPWWRSRFRLRTGIFALFALPLSAAQPPVTALAYSPDGKLLASGAYQEVLLWDAATYQVVRHAGHLAGQVRALAFRDNRTVAVAEGNPGRSGAVSLLDLDTGAVTPIQQAKDEMLAVAFSPDGKLLATGGTDPVVRVFNLETHAAPIELKGHTGWITSVAFSPDGRLFASASADKTARVWLPGTWKEEFQLPTQLTEPVNSLAFSLESDLLAFATGGPEEHAIRIWRTQGAFTELDPARPNMKQNLSQTRPIDTGACVPLSVTFLKFQPRSRMLVACTDKTLRLLANGGNTVATLSGHSDWVYAVAAAPEGQKVASGSTDGVVRFWVPNGAGFKAAPVPGSAGVRPATPPKP
jgi:WD40 repeat protein